VLVALDVLPPTPLLKELYGSYGSGVQMYTKNAPFFGPSLFLLTKGCIW
jgi:hypothetical protein